MTVQELHTKAIEIADYAFIEKFEGKLERSMHLFKEAYQLEREAAFMAKEQNVGEPSVSILLKSAASLAINANILDEAEKLIYLALYGGPPFEIAEELKNLLEYIRPDETTFNSFEEINSSQEPEKPIELLGRLFAANEEQSTIRLKVENEGNFSITVPNGLSEIVKKYWGENVKVKGNIIRPKVIRLIELDQA